MALTKWKDLSIFIRQQLTQMALVALGSDDEWYVVEVDEATGNLPIAAASVAASVQAEGTIAGTALTGSYQTAKTLSANAAILFLRSTCNQPIIISLNGGTTQAFTLDIDESITIDFGPTSRYLASGSVIQAKHAGTVPTAGSFYVTALT